MDNTSLKARLFDALEELDKVKRELDDAYEELDEVRGELYSVLKVAEKRGEMIREMLAENRELKNQLRSKPTVDVAGVQQETVQQVLHIIEQAFQPKEKECIF